ncbi:MAG: carbon starvation protein A [bacterium]|nr:MAG: carbon starvation protein A [bacterium]
MNALLIAVLTLIVYFFAYRYYARFIGTRVLTLDPVRRTPAHEFEDGVDFVPTNRIILFGHHFASIAGLGPILGPAIAVIWGWLPAVLWILLGSIFLGCVHDMSTIFISLRNRGRSIGDVTRTLVGPRARLLFLILIFFTLSLVMGTFVRIIATLFTDAFHPESVLPVFTLVFLAVVVGVLVYRHGARIAPVTIVALVIMFFTIWLGIRVPITGVGQSHWVYILITYAYIASVLPVWLLLQPRDYLNAYQLVIGMVLMYAGLFVFHPSISAPPVNHAPSGAPSLFPFLFITVACGAISGFHNLVATGTTSKQLAVEPDARSIGYGAMLAEGALAMVVVLACTSGVTRTEWYGHYESWQAASGLGAKMEAFVQGAGNFISKIGIPLGLAKSFIVVMAVGFAMTTLDSGTRLLRYNLEEIGESLRIKPLTNRFLAAFVAILGISYFGLMTVKGKPVGLTLWELFGTTNQILAALGLLAVSLFLYRMGKPIRYTLIPMIIMMIITVTAMILKLRANFNSRHWTLLVIGAIILILVAWLVVESIIAFRRHANGTDGAA